MAYERLDIEVTDNGSSRRVQRNLEGLGQTARQVGEGTVRVLRTGLEAIGPAASAGMDQASAAATFFSSVLRELQARLAGVTTSAGGMASSIVAGALGAARAILTLGGTSSAVQAAIFQLGYSGATALAVLQQRAEAASAAIGRIRQQAAQIASSFGARAGGALGAIPGQLTQIGSAAQGASSRLGSAVSSMRTNFASFMQTLRNGASSAAQAVSNMFARFGGGGGMGGGGGPGAAASGAARGIQSIEDAAKRASSALITMNTLMYSLQLGMVAVAAVKWADEWQSIHNKLDLVTNSSQELEAVQRRLFETAQRTRSGYSDIVELFQSLRLQSANLGLSMKATADLTETLAMASQIGSKGPQQAAAGLLQLTQAMALGRLSGQNLNSVLQATPRIAIAIAQGLGVGSAALRGLAEDEKLTADVIVKALQGQAPLIAEEFLKLKPTISGAFTVLNNGAIDFMGKLEASTGFASRLASGVIALSHNMDVLAVSVIAVGSALLVAFGGAVQRAIHAVMLAIAANPIGAFIALIVTAYATWTLLHDRLVESPALMAAFAAAVTGVALAIAGPLVTSLVAATAAAWSFTIALLANPLTWLAALIVGAVAAIVYFGQSTYEVQGKLVTGWQVVEAVWAGAVAFCQSVWEDISGYVVTAVRIMLAVSTAGLSEIALWIYNNWDYVAKTTATVWDAVKGYVIGALRVILAVCTLGLSEVVIGVYNNWDSIWKSTVEIWNNIKNYVIATLRFMAAVATLGLSELAVYAWNRFATPIANGAAAVGKKAGDAYTGAFNASIAGAEPPTATTYAPPPPLSDVPGIPQPYSGGKDDKKKRTPKDKVDRTLSREELIAEEMKRIQEQTDTARDWKLNYTNRGAYEKVNEFNANLRGKKDKEGNPLAPLNPAETTAMVQSVIALEKAKRMQEARDQVLRDAIGPRQTYMEQESAITQLLVSRQITQEQATKASDEAAIAFYRTQDDKLSGQMLGRLEIMKELRNQAAPLAEAMKSVWEDQTAPLRNYQTTMEAIVELEKQRLITARQAADAANRATITYLDAQTDAASGILRALKKIQVQAQDSAAAMETLFSNAFSNLEDAWVNFTKTGKIDLGGFIEGLQTDIAKATFKKYIGGPLAGFLENKLGIEVPGLKGPVGESRDNPMWVRDVNGGTSGLGQGLNAQNPLAQAFDDIFGNSLGGGKSTEDPLGVSGVVADMQGSFGDFTGNIDQSMTQGAGLFKDAFSAGAYLLGHTIGGLIGGKAGGIISTLIDGAMILHNAGAFATGGSFTVGGSGGVDSQLVQLRASPGERVSIERAGQAQDGGGVINPISISIDARGADAGVERRIREVVAEALPEAVRRSRLASMKDIQYQGSRARLNNR